MMTSKILSQTSQLISECQSVVASALLIIGLLSSVHSLADSSHSHILEAPTCEPTFSQPETVNETLIQVASKNDPSARFAALTDTQLEDTRKDLELAMAREEEQTRQAILVEIERFMNQRHQAHIKAKTLQL